MPLPPQQPTGPFQWGAGGARLTPEEIMLRRRMAAQRGQQAGDTSPVGHWTQGLGRVLDGLSSGLANRSAGKAEAANRAENDEIMALLMPQAGGAPAGDDVVMRALMSPYASDPVRGFAKMEYERRQPKAAAPHYWETNDGSLGMVGPDGKPNVLYKDPTPKVTYITADNQDGTKQLIPVVNGQVMGGGGQASGAAPGAEPPAMLPPDFNFDDEGGPASAPGGFPGGFRGLEGETVTSAYRDPARNARVGGVPNSFHTRRDERGNPMARDSVPPPGVSMSAYDEQLRRRNPWAEVINEGDHVHMEPR